MDTDNTQTNDNAPDDFWRAGAEAIEAEDQTAGYLDVLEMEERGIATTAEAEEDQPEAKAEEDQPEPEPEPEPETEPESEPETEAKADEDEPESEPETEAKAEEPEQEAKKQDHMIPKRRLDEEVSRRRALEQQLREIQQRMNSGQDTPAETREALESMELDFGDDPKMMFDKALDGDLDKANEIFANVLRKTATIAAQSAYKQARSEFDSTLNEKTARQAEDAVIAQLEDTYDFYRPGSDSYSEDAIAETVALKQGFLAQGYAPADALKKAASYYVKMNGFDAPQQESAPPPPAPEPKAPRKQEDVNRNLAANKQQPPPVTTGRGNDTKVSDLPDITKMSLEEIEALPEATRKRLRGDFV